ncbi:MAG TPA: S49 family peptidase [Thermoanaerobaculia bacterium]|nr:S49 family peptidase [Thermoanaerobaculia bacterium]HQN39648.1 S49 family peptidase [Thermoanaerobaculia bacterium]HRR14778.1 S49 family peptidase [Thermoanaerobaculia bacterium]HRS36623.1 S49 family peptidase [Thermoanaerobaculia bacterium]
MKRFFVRLFAVIGVLATLILLVGFVFALVGAAAKPRLPKELLIEVDFEQPVIAQKPDDPFAAAMMGNSMDLRDVVEGLERAADDQRVQLLVARLGAAPMAMATAQELRDAILAFRARGKKAIAWAETFGETGPGNTSYYLATAFDEIHLQPSGDVGLTGLVMESPFLAGTLEKLGVEPRMGQRYEYKNAMNTFTEKAFTPAHAEAMEAIVDSWYEQLVQGIATGRGKSPEEVRALIDGGPYLGVEAVDAGLVDALSYRDAVYDRAEELAEGEPVRRTLARYLAVAGRPHAKGARIALVYGVGSVVRGKGGFDPLSGSASMGSDTVAKALRQAIDDEKVKAILFRVDSPGGSYVASDTIWHETVRAREAGKPVVVSMGDVAGSGGYFVAMAADKIVAQPGTITGSIGVLGGKLLTRELWAKLGVTWDEVHRGTKATMWSGLSDYEPEQWARYEAGLDRVYLDFTTKAAAGRGKTREEIHAIAKGRIWSGADALRLGLVDELGGMTTALRLAREAAGLAPDAAVELKLYPEPRTPFQAVMEQLRGEQATASPVLVRLLEALRPVIRLAARLGLTGQDAGELTTPLPEPLS